MDILLQDKGDGGEVVLTGGDLKGDGTIYNAVYLSLTQGDCFSNVFEEYESDNKFEDSLNLPITMGNLRTVENEANKCLKWMLDNKVADSIDVYAYGNNDDHIEVEITIQEATGNDSRFAVVWENQKKILKKL